MLIYESEIGRVDKGWVTGFKITIYPTNRTRSPTRFIKALIGRMHYELKARGYDTMNDPATTAAFWDYVIDLMRSPPNCYHHQAVASMQISDIAEEIISSIKIK